jgi:transposase InsO family protein
VPEPQKRPRSSLIRFEADLPNETWQTDVTHWHLSGGEHVEILNMIDDHSRLFLASEAYPTVKAPDVVDTFHKAASLHGLPASLLSDNGAVFTATPRKGKVLLQTELERYGIASKNSRPYHPQTCGKIERLHQTLKRYLTRQPPQKRSQNCKPSSTHSSTTTTTFAPTAPSTDAHPYRPTTTGSRPDQLANRSQEPTSESATTRSTPTARSPCATTAACTTSA